MERHHPVRRAAVLLAVVGGLLGLSGCFKVSQDVKVRADGTGSVVLHAEVNKKALAAIAGSFGGLGGAGASPDTIMPFRPVDQTFPDGTKVRAVDGTDRSTLDASFDFQGAEEYKRKLQQVNEAVAMNPDAALAADGAIEIRRTGDRMEVSLDFGSSMAGAGEIDLSALTGVLDPDALPKVVVTITMPGAIIATNGTSQGRTVTWDLLRRDAPTMLTVASDVAEPGVPAWVIPLGSGLILLVLLVCVGFFLSMRRRAADVAAASAGPQQPGPWQPTAQPGIGTFFPPPPDRPPREPAGWPVPPVGGPAPPHGPPHGPPPGPPPWQPAGWSAPPAAEPPPAPPTRTSPAPPSEGATDPATAAPAAAADDPAEPDARPWRVPGPPAEQAPSGPALPPTQPVSSAAVTAEQAPVTPTPGWYADPAGGAGLRYWDGTQWTQHTR